ncbi:MAG: type II toxin-antitoxin system PemK/MazF family toxin [Peptococcaceae bacterium]|nr:type II toxin-antitoxin system PemK/MazF family toxin [Peptococcaceae bacterium]
MAKDKIDLDQDLKELKDKLDSFVSSMKQADDKKKVLASRCLKHLKNRIEMFEAEDSFNIPKDKTIKRGDVYWVDFGFTIGQEFGGKHPAIVLRVGGKLAIVAPLSSQEPSVKQKASGIYVEVDRVYGLKRMKRWVNVLDIRPISLQRFDFSSSGNVKGYILDRINNALKQCGMCGK